MFHLDSSRLRELLASDDSWPRLPAESLVCKASSVQFSFSSSSLLEDLRISSWYLALGSAANLWYICEAQVGWYGANTPTFEVQELIVRVRNSFLRSHISCKPSQLLSEVAARSWLKMPFTKSGFNYCTFTALAKVACIRIRPSFYKQFKLVVVLG